jgi:hypothetical protein
VRSMTADGTIVGIADTLRLREVAFADVLKNSDGATEAISKCGASLGLSVIVGFDVSTDDGRTDGILEGSWLGSRLSSGFDVGSGDGSADGILEGRIVGSADGILEGRIVGIAKYSTRTPTGFERP